jgi:hypothetical protein
MPLGCMLGKAERQAKSHPLSQETYLKENLE